MIIAQCGQGAIFLSSRDQLLCFGGAFVTIRSQFFRMLARKCYQGYWEQLVQKVRKGKWLPCNAQTTRACLHCAFISLFCTQSKNKPAPLVEWVSISRFGLVSRFSKYTFGTPGSPRHFHKIRTVFMIILSLFFFFCRFHCVDICVGDMKAKVITQNKVLSPPVLVVIFYYLVLG